MTFLFAPQALVHFFTASEDQLSFLPAVEQWTHRVFGLPPADFFPRHHLLLSSMRKLTGTPQSMKSNAARLLPLLHRGLQSSWIESAPEELPDDDDDAEWTRIDLKSSIEKLIFEASVTALFGAQFLERHGADKIRTAFFQFESRFELAASPIPHVFQPKFKAVRATLLSALKISYENGDFNDGSVVGQLITASAMTPSAVPNMLLAVLWASQANTVPTAFWTIGFLLLPEHKHYLDAVRDSVDCDNSDDGDDDDDYVRVSSVNVEEEEENDCFCSASMSNRVVKLACDSTSLLSRCCMEALRLRSASTDVRIAASDFILPSPSTDTMNNNNNKSVLIKRGSMLLVCPWISHTIDPRLFGDSASSFDPDREGPSLPGGRKLHGPAAGVGGIAGMAFGGGKFRCPGRSFAEMELGVCVGMVVAGFDIELDSSNSSSNSSGSPGDVHGLLPAPDIKKLVGVKVAEGPCWVKVRRRRRL